MWFFYGTLMDRDLLAAVIGRPVGPERLRPAVAVGWRRFRIEDRTYPTLVSAPRSSVEGRVIEGLDAEDEARILRYEGAEYRIDRLLVSEPGRPDVTARVFLTWADVAVSSEEWDFELWFRRDKERFLNELPGLLAGAGM